MAFEHTNPVSSPLISQSPKGGEAITGRIRSFFNRKPQVMTAEEVAQRKMQDSLIQKEGFQTDVHMAQSPDQEKGTTFRLDARTDLMVWNELSRMQETIKLLIRDTPDNPALTHIQQIVNRLMVQKREDGTLSKTDIAVRAEAIQKIPPEKLKGTERIFHTNQELTVGLIAIEQYMFQDLEKEGQNMTCGGAREPTVTIQLPREGQIAMELLRSVPGITSQQARMIDQALHTGDGKNLKAILSEGGAAIGTAIGVALQGFRSLDPAQVEDVIQKITQIGQSLDQEGKLLPAVFGLLGAGVGLTVGMIRSKGKGKTVTMKFSTKKRGAGERVVSSLMDHAGELGLVSPTSANDTSPDHVLARIAHLEGLRESIYSAMGLDINNTHYRSMLSLDGAYELATDDPVSLGVAPPRIIIERQIALARIVEALGKDSLAELGVEERHKAILEAYDVAARQLCADLSDTVVKEMQQRDQPKRHTLAELFEAKASDLEKGKPKEGTEEVEQWKQNLAQAEAKHAQFESAQKQLTQIVLQLRTDEGELAQKSAVFAVLQHMYDESGILMKSIQDDERALATKTVETENLTSQMAQLTTRYQTVTQRSLNQNYTQEIKDNELQAIEAEMAEKRNALSIAKRDAAQIQIKLTRLQEQFSEMKITKTEMAQLKAKTVLGQKYREEQMQRLGWVDGNPDLTADVISEKIRISQQEIDTLKKKIVAMEAVSADTSGATGQVSAEDKQTAKRYRLMARLIRAQTEGVGDDAKIGRYNEVIGKIDTGEVSLTELASEHGYDAWMELLFGDTLDPAEREMMKGLISPNDMVRVAKEFFGISTQISYLEAAKLFSKDRLITARYAQALIHDAARNLQYGGTNLLPPVDLGPYRPQEFEIRPPSPVAPVAPDVDVDTPSPSPSPSPSRLRGFTADVKKHIRVPWNMAVSFMQQSDAPIQTREQKASLGRRLLNTITPYLAQDDELRAAQPIPATVPPPVSAESQPPARQGSAGRLNTLREKLTNLRKREPASEIREDFTGPERHITLSTTRDHLLYEVHDTTSTIIKIMPGQSDGEDGYAVTSTYRITYKNAPNDISNMPLGSPFLKDGRMDDWYQNGVKQPFDPNTMTELQEIETTDFVTDLEGDFAYGDRMQTLPDQIHTDLGEMFLKMTPKNREAYFPGIDKYMKMKNIVFPSRTCIVKQDWKGHVIISSISAVNGRVVTLRLDQKDINGKFQKFYNKTIYGNSNKDDWNNTNGYLMGIYHDVGKQALKSLF